MRFTAIEKICIISAALLLMISGAAISDDGGSDPRVKAAFERGWALFSQMDKSLKNLDLAIAQYKGVLALYPNNADALWKLSETVFKKGQYSTDPKKKKAFYDESMAFAEKALALAPKKPEPRYWIAVNLMCLADMDKSARSLGLVKRAKKELRTALTLDPKNRFNTLCKAMLATIYLEPPWPLRDLDEALKFAKEAVAEDPNLTWASSILGRVYAKMGKTELARKELSRCLAISKPTYPWDSVLYDWPMAKAALAELK